MKFNLIGFSFQNEPAKKHCVIHPGTRLIQKEDDPDVWYCTMCGTVYLEKDTGNDENITSEYGPTQQTSIISAKKKKKFYDKSGNEITDPELIKEIMQGANVISYHETKIGNDKPIVTRR